MTDALVLSEEQRALIVSRANAVPSRWRYRFLNTVADLLTAKPKPSNADVITACGTARRMICVGIGPPSMS